MMRTALLFLFPATLFARESQGHTVAVRRPKRDPVAQVKQVHEASGGALRFVLLLGDVKRIACTYSPGQSIKLWERDPRIASDNQLADLDGDGVPDLAVGRLPADDLAEATTMIRKVVRPGGGGSTSSPA
jgi:hypothetical protein